jgi:hypothetical protein
LAFAFVESKKIGCHRFCFARALDKDIKSADLKGCVRKCLNETKLGANDSAKVKKTLAKFADILSDSEDQVESDAEVTVGKYKTTTGVNVRRGPCTDQGIITTLSAGSVVQATGKSRSGCGYTWYEVKGSFGGDGLQEASAKGKSANPKDRSDAVTPDRLGTCKNGRL